MAALSMYSIKSLIKVDITKMGYTTKIDNTDTNNVLFSVTFTVGNEIEGDVLVDEEATDDRGEVENEGIFTLEMLVKLVWLVWYS